VGRRGMLLLRPAAVATPDAAGAVAMASAAAAQG